MGEVVVAELETVVHEGEVLERNTATFLGYHATLQDLSDQELHPALLGVSYLFDTVTFIEKLRVYELLKFDEARQAFYLIPEVEDPDDQAFADFWGWVETLDQEAQERGRGSDDDEADW